jgi:hypothetical protein
MLRHAGYSCASRLENPFAALQFITFQRRWTQNFGQATRRSPYRDVHLPQAVEGMTIAQQKGRGVAVRREDVRHGALVEDDFSRILGVGDSSPGERLVTFCLLPAASERIKEGSRPRDPGRYLSVLVTEVTKNQEEAST